MRVEVIMPQLGESIVEGTIVEWMKQVGDTVERDEDIFTLSTDKVDAEIPAPQSGVLVEILYQVGDVVEVGKPVAYIETDAAAAVVVQDTAPAAPAEAPAEVETPAEAPAPAPAPVAAKPGKKTRISPVVNNIAAEHGITDLSVIAGTGSQGRVTKKDILAFIAAGGHKQPASAKPAPAAPAAAPAVKPAAPSTPSSAPAGWEPALVRPVRVHRYDGDRVEPMTRIQSAMSANMLNSRRTTAHCHTLWEADMTEVDKVRRQLAPEFKAKGVKLTFTAFFVAAAVSALQKFPIMNAAIDGDQIVYRRDINVGVAAASDDGLIVPVLKGADDLNLFGIAKAVNDLGGRAKTRKLTPTDIEGGTFTVSNAGIWGSVVGFPVLIPPQVGIIAIGGIKKRVVVGDDDSMRIRQMCNITLSFDHRIIDGATADGFMSHLTQTLATGMSPA